MQSVTSNPVTKAEVKAALEAAMAVAEAIRELREVPSGHLYAQVMSLMSLTSYTAVIGMLKRAKVVEETGYLLRWVGPVKPK